MCLCHFYAFVLSCIGFKLHTWKQSINCKVETDSKYVQTLLVQ